MLGATNSRADSWDAIAKTKSLLSYGSLESLANLTSKTESRTTGGSIKVLQTSHLCWRQIHISYLPDIRRLEDRSVFLTTLFSDVRKLVSF